MKTKILVNGSSGFIGSNFLEAITKINRFSVFATFNKTLPKKRIPNVKYLQADLSSKDDCEKIVKGIDYVVMLAGNLSTFATFQSRPLGYVPETTIITMNMLDASSNAGVKKFLWLSSTTGYPKSDSPLQENQFHQYMPQKPYFSVGIMSRYLEQISKEYTNKNDSFTVIALRPTGVYGPGDDFDFSTCHVLPALLRRVVENQNPIEIWGDGEDRRDWIYIDDLIEACISSIDNLHGFHAINIGSGKSVSINQVIDILDEIGGEPRIRKYLEVKKKGVNKMEFDCTLAEKKLGFVAKHSLEKGIEKTFRWYKTKQLKGSCCEED